VTPRDWSPDRNVAGLSHRAPPFMTAFNCQQSLYNRINRSGAAPSQFPTITVSTSTTRGHVMIWKNLVNQSATLASRPKILTTTFMCALSATIRFASTGDEGTRIPAQPAHTQNPLVSVTTRDGVPIFCMGWRPKPAQPLVFQRPRGCRAWPL
jgi:hypothetical protein